MVSSDRNSDIQRNQFEIELNSKIAALKAEGGGTGTPILPYDPTRPSDGDTAIQVIAPNMIDNTDFDFSKDGYANNPTVGGDAALECYNWYRERFIKVTDAVITGAPSANVQSASGAFKAAYTYPMDFVLLNGLTGGVALSGTLTRVDDNNATLSAAAQNDIASGGVLWFGDALAESSAHALKATGHSLFAANEGANSEIPEWDKTNGWAELGSDTADNWALSAPLPVNFVRAGLTFYFRCIVSLRSGATPGSDIKLGFGIWDATAAESRFVESSNLTLDGSAVGAAGVTVYDYVVLADLDDGTTIVSNTKSVTNGNASLSTSNYNRLTWSNAANVLNFRVYRRVGGVTKRIITIRNGGHDYNDYGTDEGETPASLPTAPTVRAVAYKVTESFNVSSSSSWLAVEGKLEIPSTYDTSRTTGKQWLRIAVEGLCGSPRMLTVDRVMLSLSNGGWSRSARDLNKIANTAPSSSPTTTTQGGTGVQRPECFTMDTPVIVCEADGSNMRSAPIGSVEVGMYVFSGARRVFRVAGVKDGQSSEIVRVTLSNGITIPCTPSERFITSRADTKGTRIDDLTIGDEMLCWAEGRVTRAAIIEYRVRGEAVPVRTLQLKGGHTFVVGGDLCGAIAHNLKPPVDGF